MAKIRTNGRKTEKTVVDAVLAAKRLNNVSAVVAANNAAAQPLPAIPAAQPVNSEIYELRQAMAQQQQQFQQLLLALQPAAAQPLVQAESPQERVIVRNGQPATTTESQPVSDSFAAAVAKRNAQLKRENDAKHPERNYNGRNHGANVRVVGETPVRQWHTMERDSSGKEVALVDAAGNLTPKYREHTQKHTADECAIVEYEFNHQEGSINRVGGLHVCILTGEQLAAVHEAFGLADSQHTPLEYRRSKDGNAGASYKASSLRYDTGATIGDSVVEFGIKLVGSNFGVNYATVSDYIITNG